MAQNGHSRGMSSDRSWLWAAHHGCEGILARLLEKRVLPEKVPLYLGESLLKLTGSKWHLKTYLFHYEKLAAAAW